MDEGAVAIIDALGFKGIWRKNEPAVVLEKMKEVAIAFTDHFNRDLNEDPSGLSCFGDCTYRVGFLSDTIVIACNVKPNPDKAASYIRKFKYRARPSDESFRSAERLASVRGVVEACSIVQTVMVIKKPALAYRGAIAFGEFAIQEQFIIGQAVDEAAQAEALAEGAIVWLCPSALEVFTGAKALAGSIRSTTQHPTPLVEDELERCNRLLLEYSVPIRNGQIYNTLSVNPLSNILVEAGSLLSSAIVDQPAEVEKLILGTFDSKQIDVAVKRQNTERFLACAREHASTATK